MVFGLLCRWACNICSYLYPAYASYKALSLHPESSPEAMAQVERWLMYWAVVGTWTAVEAIIGWTITWMPFYSLIKTFVLLSLSLPQFEASTYIYRSHLSPFFQEHEQDIDAFLASSRSRAGFALVESVGWIWQKAKAQFNITLPDEQLQAAAMLAQNQGQGRPNEGGYPAQDVHQPPTLSDPASGALQTAFHFMSNYAGRYMPVALTALSAATASAKGQAGEAQGGASSNITPQSRAIQMPQQMSMPVPVPTPPVHQQQSDPSLRSRAFMHASNNNSAGQYPSLNNLKQQQQYQALSSARSPPQGFSGRSASGPAGPGGISQSSSRSSDESLGSRYEGYEQIGKDELQDMNKSRSGMQGKSNWFGWGGPAGMNDDRNKID
ncbi:hypothetical protein J008_03301 [Cryptococcus neoformans]|nr:hypothetical protein AYX15_03781 [Cryptococcus neoformans var. grubii]OWZ77838.1 hypothetical protein C365_03595 [Cryptococcus neoformans var. grubii Bt85]OXG17347.1 hypothetical protein C366_03435 [Cryptococcus neoformans var. grubii Tu401-1]OXG25390.1 hypothetical protein C367_03212 [Cryptococcus neoformans var. grubii Ze90-1]OXM78924.1 hypothetical protein C364_03400 [Cryptococcus neoformans var. grubii Bt63]